MAEPQKKEKRGESNGMSFGRIMTSLLIPRDARSNPKRLLSGIAFLAFICFFLFSALGRGCHRETVEQQPEQRESRLITHGFSAV